MQLQTGSVGKILFLYYLVIPVLPLISRTRIIRILEFSFSLLILVIGVLVSGTGSIQNIVLSVPAGVFSLIITTILTSRDKSGLWDSLLRISEFPASIIKYPGRALRVLLASAQEEFVWRAAFVYLIGHFSDDRFYVVSAGTLLFYLVHLPAMRPVIFIAHLEFIIFTLFIYIIFLQTGSVLAVIIIHFMRNIYIMLVMQPGPVHE